MEVPFLSNTQHNLAARLDQAISKVSQAEAQILKECILNIGSNMLSQEDWNRWKKAQRKNGRGQNEKDLPDRRKPCCGNRFDCCPSRQAG
jgi:hypothetical protein